MKISGRLSVCLGLVILFGGCAEAGKTGETDISSAEKVPVSIFSEATETSVTSETVISEETSVSESSEYEDYCARLLDYMYYGNEDHHMIGAGCFYDFDRDGFPELAEITDGDSPDYTMYIYSIKGEEFYLMGEITANCNENSDVRFSLYKESSGEYFYIAQESTIYWGTNKSDEVRICTYRFKDDKILAEQAGAYSYIYDPDDNSGRYKIEDNYFMDNSAEPGYYDINELSRRLGINEYLSGFEKVEDVIIAPQWSYIDWNENMKIIREIVREWF